MPKQDQADGFFHLDLIGAFRLVSPLGARILIKAKRSRILLAMLATSRSGERSRQWLQEQLWGSRERTNSQASLRRELSTLRQLVNVEGQELLRIERDIVALNLRSVRIDILNPQRVTGSREDFLEGIDLAWEEGFEEWLRGERQSIAALRAAQISALPASLASSETALG